MRLHAPQPMTKFKRYVRLKLNHQWTRVCAKLCGKLIYLAHTRLDISFSVSDISQFMHDPREPHLQDYKKKVFLFTKIDKLLLEAFSDVDYASDVVTRLSTKGYYFYLGGNMAVRRNKKQEIVSRSSAKAQFHVAAHGICELLWMRMILNYLNVQCEDPMKI
ncbi:hypothetical protein V2J09_013106 [Rumex salicifolius]